MTVHTATAGFSVAVRDTTASPVHPGRVLPRSPKSTARTAPTRSPARSWLIYVLTARGDGRCYVGLTSRSLQARLRAHAYQAKRERAVRPGGFMDALRAAAVAGHTLEQAFEVHVIGQAATAEAARRLERHWIEQLGCRKPHGYNDLPGGGIGGRAGALPLELRLANGRTLRHTSIGDAIEHRNLERRRAGQPPFNPGTIYARLAGGWTAAEALDHVPHADGRGIREPIIIDTTTFRSLRAASTSSGAAVDALRSRLHRRRTSGSAVDLSHDRRRAADGHQPRRSPPLGLTLPRVAGKLTVKEYADLVGVPKSTVLYRWHMAVRAGLNPVGLSPTALRNVLTSSTDRRLFTTLILPDGRRWTGGERDLIRRVFAEPAVDAARAERLSESGVRRRLRSLTNGERLSASLVAWAFGFVRRGN